MEHVTKTAFARAEKLCVSGPDKWALLDNVTEASEAIGISHRTVSVLRALLTFLPTRNIPVGQHAIVFPSNATLCDRLHGMPESTLRRHLSHLVKAGLVSRHSSPNHKRYARRRAGVIALAFGLDLTPLAVRSAELASIAQDETQRKETLRIQRDAILVLRAKLQSCSGDHFALLHEAHLVLRRKPNSDDYTQISSALTSVLNATITPAKTNEMSTSTDENERHIDTEPKPIKERTKASHDMTLSDVLTLCTDVAVFFPEKITTWQKLITVTNDIAAMLGIRPALLSRCKEILGPEHTAILMASLLQIASDIKCPAAYLTHLLSEPHTLNQSVLSLLQSIQTRPAQIAS